MSTMTKELQKYIEFNTRKKNELEREIATKRRSLEIVLSKLSDPQFHLDKELGRGAVKVSKALGVEPMKKPKTVLKKKSDEIETLNFPTQELPLPPAASGADPLDSDAKEGFSWLSPFR